MAVILAAITAAAVWILKPVSPQRHSAVVRLTATLPSGVEIQALSGVALSADGKQLAYAATQRAIGTYCSRGWEFR